ncbi:MAG: hypothetical protein J7M26_00230, partial [Armatimonadetes bacterium]|nr:hypothetical protein [Armatimonadota bacterium]
MRMADLFDPRRLPVAPRSLHELARLRAILDDPDAFSLLTLADGGRSLLTQWLGLPSRHGELLTELIEAMAEGDAQGLLALIEGLPGAGKPWASPSAMASISSVNSSPCREG